MHVKGSYSVWYLTLIQSRLITYIRSLGESYLGYFKPYFDASQILLETKEGAYNLCFQTMSHIY